jgi:hypothetical protein
MEDWGKPQVEGEVRAFLGAVDSDACGYAAITYCQEIRLHDKAEPLKRLSLLPYSPFPLALVLPHFGGRFSIKPRQHLLV